MQTLPGEMRITFPKTLVAEPDAADAFRLQYAFRRTGSVRMVHFVSDGQETIDYLRGKELSAKVASATLPGLLLLNVDMPRVTGFEVLDWLRQHEHLRPARVVMVSCSDDCEEIARANSFGADHFLIKPRISDDFSILVRGLQGLLLADGDPRPSVGSGRGFLLAR